MVDKLNLADVTSFDNQESAAGTLSDNNRAIEIAFENTLSRDGTSPNSLAASLDMDSNRIYNLPTPVDSSEVATKGYVDSIESFATAEGLVAAVADAEAAVIDAEAAASDASDSADDAASAAEGLQATSTTTLTPTIASKTFTTQADKQFIVGGYVFAVSDADSTIWMSGQVTSYSDVTLIVDVQYIGTSSSASDWTITIAGAPGIDGTNGAAGADYTADTNLAALSVGSFTNTPGLVTQTADGVFGVRTITGTSNLITVTDGDGAAGAPTLTVGSNVVRKDSDNVLADGISITHSAHALTGGSGVTTNLALEDGKYQTIALTGGNNTINVPSSGTGEMILEVSNSSTLSSLSLAGYDTLLSGATGTQLTASGKVNWLFIWCIGSRQVAQWVKIV